MPSCRWFPIVAPPLARDTLIYVPPACGITRIGELSMEQSPPGRLILRLAGGYFPIYLGLAVYSLGPWLHSLQRRPRPCMYTTMHACTRPCMHVHDHACIECPVPVADGTQHVSLSMVHISWLRICAVEHGCIARDFVSVLQIARVHASSGAQCRWFRRHLLRAPQCLSQ